jgi:hypothetical protein
VLEDSVSDALSDVGCPVPLVDVKSEAETDLDWDGLAPAAPEEVFICDPASEESVLPCEPEPLLLAAEVWEDADAALAPPDVDGTVVGDCVGVADAVWAAATAGLDVPVALGCGCPGELG